MAPNLTVQAETEENQGPFRWNIRTTRMRQFKAHVS